MLRVRVLGELALELDGAALPPPGAPPGAALLGWLALHPGTARARRGGGAPVAGRARRERAHEPAHGARRRCGARSATRHLVADPRRGRPRATTCGSDARAFDALARAGRLDDALALVPRAAARRPGRRVGRTPRATSTATRRAARSTALADRREAAGDPRRRGRADPRAVAARPLAEDAHRAADRAGWPRPATAPRRSPPTSACASGCGASWGSRRRRRRARWSRRSAAPAAAAPPLPAPAGARRASQPVRRPRRARCDAAARRRSTTPRRPAGGVVGAGRRRAGDRQDAPGRRARARRARATAPPCSTAAADEEPLAPYQPFAEALRPHCGRSPTSCAAWRSPASSALVPDRRPAARARRRRPRPAASATGCSRPPPRCSADAAAERPVLLVLDDLHWADRPTLLLLAPPGARAQLGPLLILGTYRESELGGTRWRRARRPAAATAACERIAPRGLDERDVDALVDGWLGAARAGGLAGSRATSETGGNPFFVEEVLRHLLGAGAARRVGVPESVREVARAAARRALGEPARATRLLGSRRSPGRELRRSTLLEAAGDAAARRARSTRSTRRSRAHLIREEPGRPLRVRPRARARGALRQPGRAPRAAARPLAEALERAGGDDAELARHYLLARRRRPRRSVATPPAPAGTRVARARLRGGRAPLRARRSSRPATARARAELLLGLGEAHLRARRRRGLARALLGGRGGGPRGGDAGRSRAPRSGAAA